MGVTHFFVYLKNNFPKHIRAMKKEDTYKTIGATTDNLLIDMNGLFHNSAQKIYEYGNFKKPRSLLRPYKKQNPKTQEINFFKDVCNTIDDLVRTTQPNLRLIMCVDGPAPYSKASQQRSRRFRNTNEDNTEQTFDTSSISVGTKMMDNLSRYIDWYIRKKISEDDTWKKLEIIYSSYKTPGEGEQSLLAFIRKYGTDEETYCINGLDADIIMLALVSHRPKFYVLREDMYNKDNKFLNIDINGIREDLVTMMKFDHTDFKKKSAINDFVFFLYLNGNDFLPHIPSIEILENGIDVMMDVYKIVCKDYGHLTTILDGKVLFVPETLRVFLGTISQYEKGMLEHKMDRITSFFPDPLLSKHCKFVDRKNVLNIENYRAEYMQSKFPSDVSEQQLCHEYIEGLQWILTYYTTGVPDWNWHFKYFYAPFAFHLAKHVTSYTPVKYGYSQALTPFQQLLCILPPRSGYLLPEPLSQLLTNPESPLRQFCPEVVEFDLAGKRKEWQAIALLPMIDRQIVKQEYFKIIDKVSPKDLHRNKVGNILLYRYNDDVNKLFTSYYGDIPNSKATTEVIYL